MYYFHNSPKIILDEFLPNFISGIFSNKIFTFCAVFNSKEIFIFENKSLSLIAYFKRSNESIDVYGDFFCLEWNSDSSQIAIGTVKGFLLIFSITTSYKELILSPDKEIFFSKEGFATFPSSMTGKISLLDVISFSFKINCICLYREDLLIATEDGIFCRIRWDGRIIYNQQIMLTNICFFNDLEFSKANNLTKVEAQCRKIEWFPSLSGIIVLFQNGKSAFLHIPSHKLICEQITGVWAEHLRHANCFAVNFKFRSVAYGGKSGEGVIYKTDEETGALRLQHRLKISSSEYPDADKVTGPVTVLKWSPDNFCLAMCWENKAFSLWSVQGSLLFSSLGNKCGIGMNLLDLDWGCEGYSLWAVKKPKKANERYKLIIFQMARSVLTTNPTKDNHQHLVLLTSSSVIIGSRKSLSSCGAPLEHVTYPDIYINSNWPIKYAAIDEAGTRIVVSGKNGFAIYFMNSKKWRLFGNETQEKGLEVTGGLVWFKNIICLSCFDSKQERFEIRLYNSLVKIDDSLSFTHHVISQILMINIFDNILVALSIDGLITLYEVNYEINPSILSIQFIQTIPLENYIEFAVCVVSLNLSSLHTDLNIDNSGAQSVDTCRYRSLLVNYSGHLLMFQRDLFSSTDRNSLVNKSERNSYFKLPFTDYTAVGSKMVSFTGPLVVAYDVEIMWLPLIYEHDSHNFGHTTDFIKKMYTMENALWLNCGAHGLRVWLPLNAAHMLMGNEQKTKHTFLSKRIMLTCKILNLYPLVVLNNEALLMAPLNEFSTITIPGFSYDHLPLVSITKDRHIFLQHIIKQLLRINLGIHALDLTYNLIELPYFNHTLELLLHEVLEEEATSKEPLPDPLLPRVVAFIQEFPNFLSTLAQCARKTELALWSYLFASAGNPKYLFESCLINKELDTAASFLIILQNTEHPLMSQKHATLLLDAALSESKWSLVKDLIRFLKNIAINDGNLVEKCGYRAIKDNSISSMSYRPLHKRRYQSGGTLGLKNPRQYTCSKTNKEFDHSKSMITSLSQVKPPLLSSNLDESSSDELNEEYSSDSKDNSNVNTVQNKDSELLEELANVRHNPNHYSYRTKNYSQSSVENSTSPKVSSSESLDMFTFDNCKYSHFEKEVDMILTKFAHQQFQKYRLYNLVEFVVNSHFKENQFILWMSREKLFCFKIVNPVEAFLRLHDDFNWKLYNVQTRCYFSSSSTVLNNIDEASSSTLNHKIILPISFFEDSVKVDNESKFNVLSNDVHSHEHEDCLNRRRLRYVIQLMHKAEYWEWVVLLLLMLEDDEEIISCLQFFCVNVRTLEQIDSLLRMADFVNTIICWNIQEKTRYEYFVIRLRGIITKIHEERISELRNPEVKIDCNTDVWLNADKSQNMKEGSIVLSPVTKHSLLALGQLTIDTDLIDQDLDFDSHAQDFNAVIKDKNEEVGNSDNNFSGDSLNLTSILLNNGSYNISKAKLKPQNSLKESATLDKLREAFNCSESEVNIEEISDDVLVSTELDEYRSTIGCSLS